MGIFPEKKVFYDKEITLKIRISEEATAKEVKESLDNMILNFKNSEIIKFGKLISSDPKRVKKLKAILLLPENLII